MINRLTQIAIDEHLEIYDRDIRFVKRKGLIYNDMIAIQSNLAINEYTCILAEEIGHYKLNLGDISDLRELKNQKEELKARQWAHEQLVTFDKIIEAYEKRIEGFELADWLGVTEEFLKEAIHRYRDKYGIYKKHGEYLIYFEPFGVMRGL